MNGIPPYTVEEVVRMSFAALNHIVECEITVLERDKPENLIKQIELTAREISLTVPTVSYEGPQAVFAGIDYDTIFRDLVNDNKRSCVDALRIALGQTTLQDYVDGKVEHGSWEHTGLSGNEDSKYTEEVLAISQGRGNVPYLTIALGQTIYLSPEEEEKAQDYMDYRAIEANRVAEARYNSGLEEIKNNPELSDADRAAAIASYEADKDRLILNERNRGKWALDEHNKETALNMHLLMCKKTAEWHAQQQETSQTAEAKQSGPNPRRGTQNLFLPRSKEYRPFDREASDEEDSKEELFTSGLAFACCEWFAYDHYLNRASNGATTEEQFNKQLNPDLALLLDDPEINVDYYGNEVALLCATYIAWENRDAFGLSATDFESNEDITDVLENRGQNEACDFIYEEAGRMVEEVTSKLGTCWTIFVEDGGLDWDNLPTIPETDDSASEQNSAPSTPTSEPAPTNQVAQTQTIESAPADTNKTDTSKKIAKGVSTGIDVIGRGLSMVVPIIAFVTVGFFIWLIFTTLSTCSASIHSALSIISLLH